MTFEECFEAATDEVLESDWARKHGIVLAEQVNNGGCDKWASAFARQLGRASIVSRVEECYGHWFVVVDHAAYDIEHPEGFAVPRILVRRNR